MVLEINLFISNGTKKTCEKQAFNIYKTVF